MTFAAGRNFSREFPSDDSNFIFKEFLKWVVLSNIIAWPIAYLAMRGWLDHFAYRTRLGVLVFALSAALALAVALLTVSYHAFKAARANPVDSLRYE